MKRLVITSLLALFAGTAAAQQAAMTGPSAPQPATAGASVQAQQSAQIGTSNHTVQNNSIVLHDVYLPQSGFVSVVAPNQYGNAQAGARLGQVRVAAGHHDTIRVPLNQQRMEKYGYNEGTEQTVFVTVTPRSELASIGPQHTAPSNNTVAVRPIQIRVPLSSFWGTQGA
jgi:hypothetical protein